jgi:hypothetical protein
MSSVSATRHTFIAHSCGVVLENSKMSTRISGLSFTSHVYICAQAALLFWHRNGYGNVQGVTEVYGPFP